MIDTIKFDIPLRLTAKELKKINWSSITDRKSKGKDKCFYNIQENEFIGEPSIFYTFVKDDPTNCWLRVEVSLPKLRHGTNYYELDDDELKWTIEILKLYICSKLKISGERLPDLNAWTIKKLHICKNFNAGLKIQDYLLNASQKVVPKRKTTIYKASGNDEIQTVVWKASSTQEKFYDKHAEIIENKSRHEDAEIILTQSKGCVRYERELSNRDLRNLYEKYSTSQILSSKVIMPFLNESIERLNLHFSIKSIEIKDVIKNIEADTSINPRGKNSLIAFVSKLYAFGESKTKSSYSSAGYYKQKSIYDAFLLKNSKVITQNLGDLSFDKFDFAKFN